MPRQVKQIGKWLIGMIVHHDQLPLRSRQGLISKSVKNQIQEISPRVMRGQYNGYCETHWRCLTTFAGIPNAIEYGGRSSVTTAPAPTTHPSPTVTPPITFTPAPSQTSRPILVGNRMSGSCRIIRSRAGTV